MINLLKESKKALQFLHAEKGMDFEKPFEYAEGNGKFTLKSLEKLIKLDNTFNYVVALFVKREEANSNYYDFNYVAITDAFTNFDVEIRNAKSYFYRIDDFYGKKPFEDLRKKYNGNYYIIAQKKEYLQPIRAKNVDLSERFILDVESRIYQATDGKGKHWISEIKLIDTNSNGKKIDYKPYSGYYSVNRTVSDNIEDIIDKSGYILVNHREELKRRATQNKADKAKAEATQTDYSQRNAEYKTIIDGLKNTIAGQLLTADTREDVNRVQQAMYRYNQLFNGYITHIEYINNKKYSSVTAVEREFKAMDDIIRKIKIALQLIAGSED